MKFPFNVKAGEQAPRRIASAPGGKLLWLFPLADLKKGLVAGAISNWVKRQSRTSWCPTLQHEILRSDFQKVVNHGLHENGMAKDNIKQDVTIPWSEAADFMEWLDAECNFYPLWIYPFRRRKHPSMHLREKRRGECLWRCERKMKTLLPDRKAIDGEEQIKGPEPLLSIGVWGPRLPNPSDFVEQNRKLEEKVKECGGVK